jgi:hypothetical protein
MKGRPLLGKKVKESRGLRKVKKKMKMKKVKMQIKVNVKKEQEEEESSQDICRCDRLLLPKRSSGFHWR